MFLTLIPNHTSAMKSTTINTMDMKSCSTE